MKYRIDPAAHMGEVTLQIADLDGALSFYTERIGLRLMEQVGARASLGVNGRPLLRLNGLPNARRVTGTTGLYHLAILTPSRFELARALHHLVQTQTPIHGASDHLVSEAVYLKDPEGNGIEIYRDRPRDQWPRANGTIQMATHPLDVDGVLGEMASRENEPWTGMADGTTMGHVHLHVASIPQAKAFYHDALGFDVIVSWSSALFLSAGGYHHHLGLNTWAGVGAPTPPTDAVGLQYYSIVLPDEAAKAEVVARARAAGVAVEETERGAQMRDPSRNVVVFTVG